MYNAYISDKNGMSERRKKVKKKALYKKWMSMLLAGVVTTTGFMGGTVTLRAAETTNWVGDEGLNSGRSRTGQGSAGCESVPVSERRVGGILSFWTEYIQ